MEQKRASHGGHGGHGGIDKYYDLLRVAAMDEDKLCTMILAAAFNLVEQANSPLGVVKYARALIA